MTNSVAVEETGNWFQKQWRTFRVFLGDVRDEMRNVSSPSRKEVQATTLVVIITVFLFGVYFYVVDGVIGVSLGFIYKHLGGR